MKRMLVILSLGLLLPFLTPATASSERIETEMSEAETEEILGEGAIVTFWNCSARGRIDANLYGTFYGYATSHLRARKNALAKCGEIAAGCHIVQCRPGL
jgi:hypothetical protein